MKSVDVLKIHDNIRKQRPDITSRTLLKEASSYRIRNQEIYSCLHDVLLAWEALVNTGLSLPFEE